MSRHVVLKNYLKKRIIYEQFKNAIFFLAEMKSFRSLFGFFLWGGGEFHFVRSPLEASECILFPFRIIRKGVPNEFLYVLRN